MSKSTNEPVARGERSISRALRNAGTLVLAPRRSAGRLVVRLDH